MAATTADRRFTTLPWTDRHGRFSAVRAGALALAVAPIFLMGLDGLRGLYAPEPIANLLYWTGWWATVLLLLTLAVSPARTILRWTGAIPTRRILGVAALAYTLAHVLAYVAFDRWDLGQVLREMSALTVNIISATASALLMLALGLTSSDAAVRRLGSARWRALHIGVHAAAGLAILHYLLARQAFTDAFLFAGLLVWLWGWRVLSRTGRGVDPLSLILLTAAAALSTAALEALTFRGRYGEEALSILTLNFGLAGGASAATKVLALGLFAALAARLRRSAA